jgi:hypothetical protein
MTVQTAVEEDDPAGVVAAPVERPGRMAAVADPSTTGRRAVREARRQRRRLMALCAAVVAACLIMTVMVVGLARDRPSPGTPTGVVAPVLLFIGTPQSVSIPNHQQQPEAGTTVPEGGHP